tara:strand:- start:1449 stop:2462 length:1014 start_codon:yes stop_codon:yes gene_type:complete
MKYFENLDLRILIIFLSIFFLGFFVKTISKYFNLYDNPNSKRKLHQEPISTINGFLILLTLNIYFVLDIFLFNEFYFKINVIFLLLINIFYFIGYIDDIKNLSPIKKSVIIFIILLILTPLDKNLTLKSLIFKNLINNEIYLNQSSILITVFFIYIFYNFLNFIDGLNGVAITVAIFFITVLGLNRGEFLNLEMLIILCLLYCLTLNIKNISFLGNAGVAVLGVFISILYVFEYNLNKTLLSDEIFLIFFIPGMDMTRLVFSRIKSGKPISDGDLNHLHHYLLNITDKKYVFLIYILMTIIPFLMTKIISNNLIIIILSFIIYTSIIILLKRFPKKT